MATGLLLDPFYKQHAPGPGHPERPERYDAITAGLERDGLSKRLTRIEARPANEDEIATCHGREYIAVVKRDIARGLRDLSTGDTAVGPKSLEVAMRAVGGVLNAVDAVAGGKLKNAFCAVRPPGHHARPVQGMGFCIFNNIAIGARYAQKKHGLARVMIVDWDVHHGNGTQDIFYDDPSVFFFSTHQSPWYPGTGAAGETGDGAGKGTTLNRPFAAGSRQEILDAFRLDLMSAADSFKPELVMISAGFDSRAGDPLGQFRLTDSDFSDLTRIMMDVADKHADGRLVSVLEGGYSLEGLSAGVAAHVDTLQRV
ncbi:MAG TPA: histone deacetylase [Bryobacteraceae bacterium]|nr:histone deacetylase [Bryobacteraceae bacterium]